MDSARQLLDELMGRNRNLDPEVSKCKKLDWEDPEYCQYYNVRFCPHDLFVNTKADLGQCAKRHDDEAKRLYADEPRTSIRKRQYEDEFLRFCNSMVNEVDRKIQKGRMRLLLMNKNEPPSNQSAQISKQQEQLNILNERIKKLVGEAEEAGHRGDVDQAQGLMKLCDQLKDEKEALLINVESAHWSLEMAQAQEKQMEVCEVCGAFLIVGDAQQRIEDHLTGKQHLGYSRVRKVIEEIYEERHRERSGESDKRRYDDEKRSKYDNGSSSDRRREERYRKSSRDRDDYDRRRDDHSRHRSRGSDWDRERSRDRSHRSKHHRDRRRSRSRSEK
ncbi:luc7-like protein [Sergentomyia squamirostris]